MGSHLRKLKANFETVKKLLQDGEMELIWRALKEKTTPHN